MKPPSSVMTVAKVEREAQGLSRGSMGQCGLFKAAGTLLMQRGESQTVVSI